MLAKILSACVLVAVTVAVHGFGLGLLIRALWSRLANPPAGFWSAAGLLRDVDSDPDPLDRDRDLGDNT
jgi:hypothetical protein